MHQQFSRHQQSCHQQLAESKHEKEANTQYSSMQAGKETVVRSYGSVWLILLNQLSLETCSLGEGAQISQFIEK